MKKRSEELLKDMLHVISGSFIYTMGVYCFTAPNQIAPGGVTGLSTMINALTNIPMGILTFALNAPLLLLAFFFVGKKFAGKTLITITIMTFCLDVVLVHFPVYQGDMILGALFGGGLMGVDWESCSCGTLPPAEVMSSQKWFRSDGRISRWDRLS